MSDPDAPEESQDPNQNSIAETAGEADFGAPIPSSIQFYKKGLDNNLLTAVVEPSEDFPGSIASGDVQDWIRRQGCEEWLLHEETIWLLAKEARRLETRKEYVVAERKDCQIEIQTSSDRLRAWIRVSPAFGGIAVTDALIRQALGDHRISFGIHESLIRQIAEDGQCDRTLIAEGNPPTPGQSVKFEELVKESEHKGIPQEREHGRVDYKDLGLFLSVTSGTPLLKHIPPTTGAPGTGIDGNPIPAPPPVDRPIVPSSGTALSKDDPEIIVATRSGQPFFFENSVRVDPTLEIDAVDPSTGNVLFDGNIVIRGPVESGFNVKAGQDLTVLDTVEGANLTAGRNMLLLTGVYGRTKSEISAGGNLEARFLSDCTVRCGGNMEITDLIAHCAVECEGTIYLGKNGGKGQSYGGRLVAMRGIQAQILGSVSEMITQVELAPPRALLIHLAKTEEQIDAARKSLAIIEKKIESSKGAAPAEENPTAKDLAAKAAALTEKLAALKDEHAILQEKVDASHKGRIKAAEVHRGVTLRIGKSRQVVTDYIENLYFMASPEEKPPQSS